LFERPHHQRIAQVLQALNAPLLLHHHCLFGGGTAIALTHGEYRESIDVDFVCSSVAGYRELRSLVHEHGMRSLMAQRLELAREPRIDQYGIRCAVKAGDTPIKFEIVFEGRIALDAPLDEDRICGVWSLTAQDKVATKLMANSDRWADDSVMSRDIIDLAMLTDSGILDPSGVEKAVAAYGPSVITDLDKARAHVLAREGRLALSMSHMGMHTPIEELRSRIQGLQARLPEHERPPGPRPGGTRS